MPDEEKQVEIKKGFPPPPPPEKPGKYSETGGVPSQPPEKPEGQPKPKD